MELHHSTVSCELTKIQLISAQPLRNRQLREVVRRLVDKPLHAQIKCDLSRRPQVDSKMPAVHGYTPVRAVAVVDTDVGEFVLAEGSCLDQHRVAVDEIGVHESEVSAIRAHLVDQGSDMPRQSCSARRASVPSRVEVAHVSLQHSPIILYKAAGVPMAIRTSPSGITGFRRWKW